MHCLNHGLCGLDKYNYVYVNTSTLITVLFGVCILLLQLMDIHSMQENIS